MCFMTVLSVIPQRESRQEMLQHGGGQRESEIAEKLNSAASAISRDLASGNVAKSSLRDLVG